MSVSEFYCFVLQSYTSIGTTYRIAAVNPTATQLEKGNVQQYLKFIFSCYLIHMLDSIPGARKITTEVIPIAVTSEIEEAKMLFSLLSDLGKFYLSKYFYFEF